MQLDMHMQMLVDNAAVKAIVVTSSYNPDEGYVVFTDVATLSNQSEN